MNIITGRRGQPHVTSQQCRDTNTAIFGGDSCVLNVGKLLKAERIDTNTIRIYDGQVSVQGCIASIEANEYDDVTIENGTIGKQRYDLITAHYTKTDDGEGQYVEDVSLIVIKGAEISYANESSVLPIASTAVDSESIRDGAMEYDFPLYQVHIQELDIVDVVPLFDIANYDTGWISFNYGVNFKDHSSGPNLKYRKKGNLVEFRGSAQAVKELVLSGVDTESTIGYLPADCSPNEIIRELCQGSMLATWVLTIRPSGQITAMRYKANDKLTNIPNGAMMLIHTMFYTD